MPTEPTAAHPVPDKPAHHDTDGSPSGHTCTSCPDGDATRCMHAEWHAAIDRQRDASAELMGRLAVYGGGGGRCGRALSTGQPCPDHPAPAEWPRAHAEVRAQAYRDAAAHALQWFGPDQGQLVAGWLLRQAEKQEPGPPYRCAHCGQEITAIPGRPEAYVWTGDVPADGEWMKRYHLDTRFPECRAASGAFGLVQPAEPDTAPCSAALLPLGTDPIEHCIVRGPHNEHQNEAGQRWKDDLDSEDHCPHWDGCGCEDDTDDPFDEQWGQEHDDEDDPTECAP